MPLEKKDFKKIVSIGLVSLLFLVILLYATSRTSFLSQGVSLSVSNLTNGQTLSESVLMLEGTAKRAVRLTINDRELLIDETGAWTDIFVASPGYNTLVFKAEDKFNNKKILEYTVWLPKSFSREILENSTIQTEKLPEEDMEEISPPAEIEDIVEILENEEQKEIIEENLEIII